MDKCVQSLVANFNDGAEEGEIMEEDNNAELGVDLSYDTVSSSSLAASNNSVQKDVILCNELRSPESLINDEILFAAEKTSRRKSKQGKIRDCLGMSDSRGLPKKHKCVKHSKRAFKTKMRICKLDCDKSSVPVLHHAKDSNLMGDFFPPKSADKTSDIIFISDDDRHTRGFVSARRGSTQEKENHRDHRSSKSSEKEREFSRKKFKHRKYSSKHETDHYNEAISGFRRKCKGKFSKYHKDRIHRHLSLDTCESDSCHTITSRHHSNFSSNESRTFDRQSKPVRDNEQNQTLGKVSQKEHEVISSNNLVRFKDNILMRKLLESGTIRTRRNSCGSDLNCEIGSVSTVSSPEFGLFEDIHINDVESLDSNEGIENTDVKNENRDLLNCSDDSEIEVIIPQKKQPELIELKSDAENDPDCTSQVAQSSAEGITVVVNVDRNDDECVNISSPPAVEEATVTIQNHQSKQAVEIAEQQESENKSENDCHQDKQDLPALDENHIEDEDVLQLRLAALRSAVLKKHMDRLQKRGLLKSGTISKEQRTEVIEPTLCEGISRKNQNVEQNDYEFCERLDSLLENATCPDSGASPYSPNSSYGSPVIEDNNIEEQDMEIAATDDDDNCIDEPDYHISTGIGNYYENHDKAALEVPVYDVEFQSGNASSQVLTMSYNTLETTEESVEPATDKFFNEVPQPLPPGVEVPNLPTQFNQPLPPGVEPLKSSSDFNHPFFVPHRSISDTQVSANFYPPGDQMTSNSLCHTFHDLNGSSCDQSNYYQSSHLQSDHHNLLSQNQFSAVESNSYQQYPDRNSERVSDDNNHQNPIDYPKDVNETPDNTYKNSEIDPIVESGEEIIDIRYNPFTETKNVSSQDNSNESFKYNFSENSLTLENSKLVTNKVDNENLESYSFENHSKTVSVENLKSVKSFSISEKSQDSLQDDDDEDLLRAKLLTSLSNRIRSSLSDVIPAKKTDEALPVKSKMSVIRKRLVIGRTRKQNKISSSLSDCGSVPLNSTNKVTKQNLKVMLPAHDLNNKLKKLVVSKRRVIPPSIPVVKNASKFIIRVGEDSDSGDDHTHLGGCNDCSSDVNERLKGDSLKSTEPTSKSVKENTPDLERSVDLLLKQVRKQCEVKLTKKTRSFLPSKNYGEAVKVIAQSSAIAAQKKTNTESKQKNSTPLAVRHLPKSQQEEYHRLKQQILEKERLRQQELLKKKQQLLQLQQKQQQLLQVHQQYESSKITSEVKKKLQLRRNSLETTPNDSVPLKSPHDTNFEKLCSKCQLKVVTDLPQKKESNELLSSVERKLISERYTIVDNTVEIDLLLQKLELQTENHTSANNEVLRLREQLLTAESHLENSSKKLKEMKNNIRVVYKKLLDSKLRSSHYAKTCKEVGMQVIGTSYELPKDGEELLNEKHNFMKRKYKCLSNVVLEKSDLNCNKEDSSSNDVNSLPASGNPEIVGKDLKRHSDNSPVVSIDAKKSKVTELNNQDKSNKLFITQNNKATELENSRSLDLSKTVVNSLSDYVSPLNHLYRRLSRDATDGGKSNHDAILCPYDLRGSCMDDSCPYQH
ncbi:uncharacterized protein LOC142318855 [Lycorma delicatula]|uniref:uncharacterized protein LOC142318855 n=1 Tax=Lycorma delicatula TaxID=130591 RepID=UPI003F517214